MLVNSPHRESKSCDYLTAFSRHHIKDHYYLSQGDIIRSKGSLFEQLGFANIYCTIQNSFGSAFAVCRLSQPWTRILWLIRIFSSESQLIKAIGCQAFEEILEKFGTDVSDLKRKPTTSCL
ncbi:suppressor of fused domain protein [Methylobacterium sp. 4-46]|uniref:suppressor of fused domain protein n=1 Tax=Methylobacterium sp. CB376 TaxID=3138063 RepID=UPI000A079D16